MEIKTFKINFDVLNSFINNVLYPLFFKEFSNFFKIY
jgi:hypothetical protein